MTALLFSLLLAADVPPSLLSRADQLNLEYVECLYATMRSAQGDSLSAPAFAQRLDRSCLDEQSAAQEAIIAVMRMRGDPQPRQKTDRLFAAGRRDLIEQYRKLPELEQMTKQFLEACKKQPDACRMKR